MRIRRKSARSTHRRRDLLWQDTDPFTVAPGTDDTEGGGYVGFDQYDVVTQEFTSNHVAG
jgi:hypothetical protein